MAHVAKLFLVSVGVGVAVVAWVIRKRSHGSRTAKMQPLLSRLRSYGFGA